MTVRTSDHDGTALRGDRTPEARRTQWRMAATLGMLVLGVASAVVGALVVAPLLGTQPQPAKSAASGAPGPMTHLAPLAEERRAEELIPQSAPSGNDAAPAGPEPLTGTIPAESTGRQEQAEGAAQAAVRSPVGPPLPPALALQRIRARLEQGANGAQSLESPTPRTRLLPGEQGDTPAAGAERAASIPGGAGDASRSPGERAAAPGTTASDGGRSGVVPGPEALSSSSRVGDNAAERGPGPAREPAVQPRGRFRFRVRLGSFASEEAAEKYRNRMFEQTRQPAEIVREAGSFRLDLGAYPDRQRAEELGDLLRAHGYAPEVSEVRTRPQRSR